MADSERDELVARAYAGVQQAMIDRPRKEGTSQRMRRYAAASVDAILPGGFDAAVERLRSTASPPRTPDEFEKWLESDWAREGGRAFLDLGSTDERK